MKLHPLLKSHLVVGRSMALSLALLGGALRVSAMDWPQWRGVDRDGRSPETGLLKQWPSGGPRLVWKITGLGEGYSGVTLAGNRIFVTGDLGESNYVFALDRVNGERIWSAKLGKSGAPGWGGFAGPRSSVTIDGERVYALGQYGEFVCLQTADGKELWRKHLSADFGGQLPEWGYSESPLVDGNQVMITPGGSRGAVVALNKMTGTVVWQSKGLTDEAQYSSLVISGFGGIRHYVLLTAAHVAGIAAQDGSVLWQANRVGQTAVITTPIVKDDLVYVTSGYNAGCNLFKVTKSSADYSVEQVYANKEAANHHGGVILHQGHLYSHSESKGWVCQELLTGRIVWSEKERIRKGSVVFADGRLILRAEAEAGTVTMIEATPAGFQEKGRFDPPERSKKNSWPHPVVADGKLYLRDQDVLLCYDLKNR